MAYSLTQFKEVLDGLGFNLGPNGLNGNYDNTLDVYTQGAIREFKAQYNLTASGFLDPETDVRAAQIIRNLQYSLNLVVDARLPVTEFYGPLTLRAVKVFQQRYGFPATGIASLSVRKKLDEEAKKRLPRGGNFNAPAENEVLQQAI